LSGAASLLAVEPPLIQRGVLCGQLA
jgi:hypothetical protein